MPHPCDQAWHLQGFALRLDLLQGDHQCALQHSFPGIQSISEPNKSVDPIEWIRSAWIVSLILFTFSGLAWLLLECVHHQVHLLAPDLAAECQLHLRCRLNLR